MKIVLAFLVIICFQTAAFAAQTCSTIYSGGWCYVHIWDDAGGDYEATISGLSYSGCESQCNGTKKPNLKDEKLERIKTLIEQ